MHVGTVSINTERIVLRKLVLNDAKSLFELGILGNSQDEAYTIVQNMISDYHCNTCYHWGIEFDNIIVGRVKVSEISLRDNFAELAYDIAPLYRNKGIMTEAVRAVIKFLFNETSIRRIIEHIRADNFASNRIAQKCGMCLEGVLRKHFKKGDNSYIDVNFYGINKDDLCI